MSADTRHQAVHITRTESRLISVGALALAVGSALLLTELARSVPTPRALMPTFAKALAVTTVFQLGLLWASHARGRQKWFAALLMIPGLLIFGGMAGEVVSKVIRGYPLRAEVVILAFGGVTLYLWTYWRLLKSKSA